MLVILSLWLVTYLKGCTRSTQWSVYISSSGIVKSKQMLFCKPLVTTTVSRTVGYPYRCSAHAGTEIEHSDGAQKPQEIIRVHAWPDKDWLPAKVGLTFAQPSTFISAHTPYYLFTGR